MLRIISSKGRRSHPFSLSGFLRTPPDPKQENLERHQT